MTKLDARYFQRDPLLSEMKQSDLVYPEKYQKRTFDPFALFIHHSAGPEMIDWDHGEVERRFSSDGYGRCYAKKKEGKVIGHHPSFHQFAHSPGDEPNFSPTQFALHKHGGEWCLVCIVRYTLSDVCWHTADVKWYPESNEMAERSFAIEICGNYSDKKIDEKALDYLASIFGPYHKYLVENWSIPEEYKTETGLTILGHRDVANTVCPGLIYEQLPDLRKKVYEYA